MKHILPYTSFNVNESYQNDFDESTQQIIDLLFSGGFQADLAIELIKGLKDTDEDQFNKIINYLSDKPSELAKVVDKLQFSTIGGLLGVGGFGASGLIMNSSEYKKLKELGFEFASSQTQIKNGTWVFRKDGATNRIGIFKNGYIRRLLPPGSGKQDPIIKQFDPDTFDETTIYLLAMQYVADHIDSTDTQLRTKKATSATVSSPEQRAQVIAEFREKIRAEFSRAGFSSRQINYIAERARDFIDSRSSLVSAKKILSSYKKSLRRGTYPVSYSFLFPILFNLPTGFTWIFDWPNREIVIPVELTSLYKKFNLVEQRQQYPEAKIQYILFENESQIEELRTVFNNYIDPILNEEIKIRVANLDHEKNHLGWIRERIIR
jgi:hypothetical protein